MAKQYSGPVPAKLTLLANLKEFSSGDKVRFLGCVTSYNRKSAILTLEHNFPVGNLLKAEVNIQLLIGGLTSQETRVGEWVNVMGYIESIDQVRSTRSFDSNFVVPVQAVVLWPSGPIHLDLYERSLTSHDQEVSTEKKA
ncbi:telomere length regulation ten1 protein [Rutstroemia sp. NJR-2017a WRK4]|nr:telomere length regulation ten1 protein [Rutstroemia sp. NJR-2017a WRK4]